MKTTTRHKTNKLTRSRTASELVLHDVRGNAKRSHARYLELARASERLGDHVATEILYQHAEHYIRLAQESRR
jgi:hypothetical protein